MASNAPMDFKVYPLSLILELLVFVAFATVGFLALLLYMNPKAKPVLSLKMYSCACQCATGRWYQGADMSDYVRGIQSEKQKSESTL